MGSDGRGAVVWSEPAEGGAGFAIYERAVSKAGALATTQEVSEAPAGAAYTTAYHPTIRFAADGTATIVWLESSYSSHSCFAGGEGEEEPCEVDEYVKSRQVEPGGALAAQVNDLYHRHAVYPTGGPFGGSSPAYVAYGQPAIAGGPGAALTVVWGQSSFSEGCQGYAYSSSYHDGGCEAEETIQWARLNAAGEAQGAPQVAYTSTTTGYGSGQPLLRLRVGAASDGTATVLFSVRIQAEESQCWGGESAIEVLQIRTGGEVGSAHELDSGCGSIDPRLVVQSDGSALAAWGWEGTYTSDEALLTRIGTDGVPGAAEPLLDEYEGTRIGGIDLARGPAGSARAVWSDDGTIKSREIPPSGSLGPIGTIATSSGAYFSEPSIALGPDGSGAVVWEAPQGEGSYATGLQGTELAADGTPGKSRTLLAANRWDHGARVSAGGDGSVMASWRVSVPHENKIQAVRLSTEVTASNDDFASAQVVDPELPSFAAGSNEGASKEPGEPEIAGDPGGASAWYSWTPSSSGPVSISTCASGSLDTLLGVYTGSAVNSLTTVADVDEGAGAPCSSGDSEVRFEASAGTTYYIAVDGKGHTEGSFGLKISSRSDAPANDNFTDAKAISSLPFGHSETNVDASKETGEPTIAGDPGGASVWFSWTAAKTGEVLITACGSEAAQALLGVYTGSALGSLTQVGAANGTGDRSCEEAGSGVRVNAVSGTTYKIAVDGRNGREGRFELQLYEDPANDAFANAQTLSGLPTSVSTYNYAATKQAGEPEIEGNPGGASVWYSWTPSSSGTAYVSLCAYGNTGLLGVYTGSSLNGLTAKGTDAGTGSHNGCNPRYSEVQFTFTAGTKYYIAVDEQDGRESYFNLSIESFPSNDDFANAQTIASSLPQSVYGSNRHATRQAGEPEIEGNPGGASVWYSWTPSSSGTAYLSACVHTNKKTLLGAYAGTTLSGLSQVGADINGGNSGCYNHRTSEVRFEYTAGTKYYFALDAEEGAQSSFSMSLESVPANDDFADAQAIEALSEYEYVYGSNAHASREADEPTIAGDGGGASVWYSWTPSSSGTAIISACLYANENALLGVYTGADLADLDEVASDNGSGPTGCYDHYSRVRFDYTEGTTYHIALDGEGGAKASFFLDLEQVASNDSFAAAQEVPPSLPNFIYGSNTGATRESSEPEIEGDPGGASVWYSWTPTSDTNATISVCSYSYGVTPLLGVYTGSSVGSLTEVGSGRASDSSCFDGGTELHLAASAGTTYHIAVDASQGASLYYELDFENPVANDDFAGAQELGSSLPQYTSSSNVHASKQSGEPEIEGDPGGASVWYSWTPSSSGTAVVTACFYGSHSALLGVYTGSDLGDLSEKGTDAGSGSTSGCSSRSSRVRLEYQEGVKYYIAVDGQGGEQASFSLSIEGPPANDDFGNAQTIEDEYEATVYGSNYRATRQSGEPQIEGQSGGASVWYAWTPASSRTVHISACAGSDITSLLGVYTGTDLEHLSTVAAADGGSARYCGPSESRVHFHASAGTTYYIAVDAEEGAEASFTLKLGGSAFNDDFENAEQMFPEYPYGGVNFDATRQPGEPEIEGNPGGASVWYSWTAEQSGPVRVDTCYAPFEAALGVYTGESLATLQEVAAQTGGGGCSSGDTHVIFDALAGTTYHIAVDGANGGEGYFSLLIFPPAKNDVFGQAQELNGAEASAYGTNFEASHEPSEPEIEGNGGGALVWYRWTAPSNGNFRLNTCAASFDTLLAVYEPVLEPPAPAEDPVESVYGEGGDSAEAEYGGGSVQGLAAVAENDDANCASTLSKYGYGGESSGRSRLTFHATEGTTYYFAVDGKSGAQGSFWLELFPVPQTQLLGGPPQYSPSTSASFSYTSTRPWEVDHYECDLDGDGYSTCPTESVTYSGLTEGQHTFEVRAINESGEADETPASETWTVDTTPPDTSIEEGPSGTVASKSARFKYGGTPAADAKAFECSLDGGAFQSCPAGETSYVFLADGPHSFKVRAVDAAGNADPSPATRAWTVDTTPPDTSIEEGPSGTVASNSAHFSYGAAPESDLDHFECRLDGAPFATCPADGIDLTGLPDGTHSFAVRGVDAVGNVDQTPATRTWTVDTTPPVVSFTQRPAEKSPDASPTIEFEANEPASFECDLDGGGFSSCESPQELSELLDGPHKLEVKATDAVGNVASPVSVSWTVDTVSPQTLLSEGPEGTVTSAGASFEFESSEDGSSFECQLDGSGFNPCSSPQTYSGIADGEHTFEVQAIDEAGNVDQTPEIRTWTIDTTPPDTEIESGPSGTIFVHHVEFTYQGSPSDDTDHFECELDGAGFSTCPDAGIEYENLHDGSHSFRVRAVDAVGNADRAPAESTFDVQTTPPETTIVNGPSGASADASPSFEFESNEEGSSFECQLDDSGFAACSSPQDYSGLADGPHTFEVRAINSGGAADDSPASRSFTVDATPSDTAIDSGPSGTVATSAATFAFHGDPESDTASFECSIDGAPFSSCSGEEAYHHLAEGTHSFEVRALDAAGNADPSPASRSWTVDFSGDTTPPQTSITEGPEGTTASAEAHFGLASSEEDSSFECQLDAGEYEPCESPQLYPGLADGSHTLSVRATDPAGNTDASAATREWTVDTTPPDTSIESGPAEGETIEGRKATFTYAGHPGADTAAFQCRLDQASFQPCPEDGKSYSSLPAGQHTFEVRALDAVGNADQMPASRDFVVPPDRAPEASLALDQSAGVAPYDVSATITGTDPDEDPLTYSLSFGDGSPLQEGSLPGGPIGHTYNHAGTFQVRLVISDGELSAVRTAVVTAELPEPLKASAGDSQHVLTGEAVHFDAAASRPSAAIDSYAWDFGDGSHGSGVAPSHAYSDPGTYTTQLTVESGSETDSASTTVYVEAPPHNGLKVHVKGGGSPLGGATVTLIRPDGSRQSATSDSEGLAFLPGVADGSTTVYATAPGYRAAALTVTVQEGEGEVEADLAPGEPGAATLETKRLTYEEIIEKGIDVADPENSHVYEAKIHLFFVPEEEETIYVTPEGVGCASHCGSWVGGGPGGGGGGGGACCGGGFAGGGYQYLPSVTYVDGEPLIQWLVLPIRASFLKEFFEVKMVLQNLTSGLTFAPGVAALQLPAGLSLAPIAGGQELQQEVGPIPSDESRTVSWTVRGDVEGEYDLSADYSASLEPLDEPIYLRAETQDPLKVWGASALKTQILVDEKAVRWAPYEIEVEMTNVSDAPVYNMQVEMLEREADAPENEALFFYAPLPPQVQGTARIEPSETWTAKYVLYPGLGDEEVTHLKVLLEDSFVEYVGGDVDLKPTLGLRSGPSLGPAAGPVNVQIGHSGGEDQAELSWQQPSAPSGLAVTGYELWTRQRLDRGEWVPYKLNISGTSIDIPARERSVGRYYAVGTKYSDGSVAFVHQIGVGPARYVALGDSFSSGEGVPEFTADTSTDHNKCHRSERGSYSERLVADEGIDANLWPATFAACSGAIARDIETPNPRNDGEEAQKDHVNQFTNLVTLTMGGNDIGFADIAGLCAAFDCAHLLGRDDQPGSPNFADAVAHMWDPGLSIQRFIQDKLGGPDPCLVPITPESQFWCGYQDIKAIRNLFDTGEFQRVTDPGFLYNGTLRARLKSAYRAIGEQAPNAEIIVQQYPQIAGGSISGTCMLYGSLPMSLDANEQLAVNAIVVKLDEEIANAANEANAQLGATGVAARIEVVDAANFAGHELCRNGSLNPNSYFNSIVIPGVTGPNSDSISYSFHPNKYGQEAFEEDIANRLRNDIQAHVAKVMPNEQANVGTAFVPYGGHALRATSSWRGSTVTMSLKGPGGETYDADSPGVKSGSTPTSEWLEVEEPEQGTWTVQVFGKDVSSGGEPVQVSAYADVPPPPSPEVQARAVLVEGQPETYELVADGPPDAHYEWTFSDGGSKEGAIVQHTFPGSESLWATVHVTDSDGGEGWFPVEIGAPASDDAPPEIVGVPGDQSAKTHDPAGAAVQYQLPVAVDAVDGEVPVSCSPPPESVFLPGSTTVQCSATDSAHNTETASFEVSVDYIPPPETSVTSGPSGPTKGTSPSFGFDSDEATATFECKLDSADFAPCGSPQPYTGLADGPHTFEVRALDEEGYPDPTPAKHTFTVDTVPPTATIGSGPSGPTNNASPSFGFSSEAGATFECKLDSADFAPCGSPQPYTGLTDGPHTFEVRATDEAGNVEATPAKRTFTVDTVPPTATITSGPSGPTNDSSPSFGFSSEAGASFECSVDSGAFAPCSPPTPLSSLADGPHTFEVRATDQAGNVEPTPAKRTFTVDTTPPETTITSGPSGPTKLASPSFVFESNEAPASFECSIDSGAFAACASPKALTSLSEGVHTFEARAVDAAGNQDASPAKRTFTVDTTPPETTITSGPSGSTSEVSPTFGFSSEPAATFECKLDSDPFATCSSPKSYSSLSNGSHTFEVRATDLAGNVDQSPASRAFTITTTPPPPIETQGNAPAVTQGPPPTKRESKPVRCRKGFRKKVVNGKEKCVRAKRPHHKARRSHGKV